MVSSIKKWKLQQKWGRHIFCISLVVIALIALVQTYWLMPRHFTQVDDIGVAESLMVRNMDYRDDCEKNIKEIGGQVLLWVLKKPERVCQITTKLNRLSIIPSLWTYAPVQFWITQGFLTPSKIYSYEEVKYWGRLPSYIFYVLGVCGFYGLLRFHWYEFSQRPLLVFTLAVFLGLSLEERIHAAQMHSYAIGIFANVVALFAYLKLINLKDRTYLSIFTLSGLFAISIGMQYQAILLVAASLVGVFISNYLITKRTDLDFFWRYSLLVAATVLITYCVVGNIFEFSSRGANWNAGPNGEFIVQGNSFFEKLHKLINLIVFQTPENLYSIVSGIELSNSLAYVFGLGLSLLIFFGFLYLWKIRGANSSKAVLTLFSAYAAIYFSFIFLGKLTFSPTRHFLFYLPIAIILVGYAVLGIKNKTIISYLKIGFIGYCLFSLINFVPFSKNRMDKVSDGYFNKLLQQSKSSFLIFDGSDIEPMFTESTFREPMFWFASGGFSCAHKGLLIPRDRSINFITFGKYNPLSLPNTNLEAYIGRIINDCTPHTINAKQILSIQSEGYLINDPSATSVEFSSRVLNAISINNQFILRYELKLNFDSLLYDATLNEGIDFSRSSYPSFMKYVSGISQREGWGRWTDANQGKHVLLGFNSPLPKRFLLELEAIPFDKNIGKVTQIRVGNQIKTIVVDDKNRIYSMVFENIGSSDVVEITAPGSSEKKIKDGETDPRQIGIGLISLKIKDLDKHL